MTTNVPVPMAVQYTTRAQLVTALNARMKQFPEGWRVQVGELTWVKMAASHGKYGTDPIPDMPGYAPHGWASPDHWATNTTPGTTDMTAAFQACLDYCGDLFSPMRLLLGDYRLTDTVYMALPVQLSGVSVAPTETAWWSGDHAGRRGPGSWIYFDHLNTGIKCGGEEGNRENVAERWGGHILEDFGMYRNQPTSDTGWTPTVNEFDIVIEAHDYCNPKDGRLSNLCFWNTYKAFRGRRDPTASLGNFGGHHFYNITGQPLHTGFEIDDSFQICTYTNCRWWVWYMNEPNTLAWTRANGVGWRMGRVDGHKFVNCFSYGYSSFLQTFDSVSSDFSVFGATIFLVNCGSDNTGTYGYHLGSDHADIRLVGCESFNGEGAFYTTGDDNQLTIVSGRFRRLNNQMMNIGGTGNRINIIAPDVIDHDYTNTGSNVIYNDVGNNVHVAAPPHVSRIVLGPMTGGIYGGGGTYTAGEDGMRAHGLHTASTDGSGYLLIPHTFTITPTFAQVQIFANGSAVLENFEAILSDRDNANLTVLVINATTNAPVASTQVNIMWEARRF